MRVTTGHCVYTKRRIYENTYRQLLYQIQLNQNTSIPDMPKRSVARSRRTAQTDGPHKNYNVKNTLQPHDISRLNSSLWNKGISDITKMFTTLIETSLGGRNEVWNVWKVTGPGICWRYTFDIKQKAPYREDDKTVDDALTSRYENGSTTCTENCS